MMVLNYFTWFFNGIIRLLNHQSINYVIDSFHGLPKDPLWDMGPTKEPLEAPSPTKVPRRPPLPAKPAAKGRH